MAVRGRNGSAQEPYPVYLQSYLPITIFFHNAYLSWPYLWKYKRDWNENWCI